LPGAIRTLIEQTVNPALPGLTNLPDGRPQIVYSTGNVGLVTSRGMEASAAIRLPAGFLVEGAYTLFDFTLVRSQPGLEPKPNAPRNRLTSGVTYEHARLAASFHHRWVDDFRWASGLFVGAVPSYNTSDLNGSFRISEQWNAGVNVSNVFNQRHYE